MAKEGKLTLFIPFFIIGCVLPRLFHQTDLGGDGCFIIGLFFGLIGWIIAVIYNFRVDRKKRQAKAIMRQKVEKERAK